ncbi:hypothetical protein ACFQU7_17075 [Pseudoroseomonas wenyumeiae]
MAGAAPHPLRPAGELRLRECHPAAAGGDAAGLLNPGQSFTIQAEASWLVCEQVCIPEEGRFTLTLPVEAAARPDAAMAPLFQQAEAELPRPSPGKPASASRARRARCCCAARTCRRNR